MFCYIIGPAIYLASYMIFMVGIVIVDKFRRNIPCQFGSKEIIGNNLKALAEANAKLHAYVQELTTYDFTGHFKTLQTEIAEQVKSDLRKEVDGVQSATGELGLTN